MSRHSNDTGQSRDVAGLLDELGRTVASLSEATNDVQCLLGDWLCPLMLDRAAIVPLQKLDSVTQLQADIAGILTALSRQMRADAFDPERLAELCRLEAIRAVVDSGRPQATSDAEFRDVELF